MWNWFAIGFVVVYQQSRVSINLHLARWWWPWLYASLGLWRRMLHWWANVALVDRRRRKLIQLRLKLVLLIMLLVIGRSLLLLIELFTADILLKSLMLLIWYIVHVVLMLPAHRQHFKLWVFQASYHPFIFFAKIAAHQGRLPDHHYILWKKAIT